MRALELGLARGGPALLARKLAAGRTVVLAYHNILPDGATAVGERSLHLPRRRFAAQLDALRRTHDIIPLAAVAQPSPSGARPRAAITFDDAYRGTVTAGFAEIVTRGLPATVFVAPAFVGGRAFWWDAFADQDSGVVPETLRDEAVERLAGDDAAVRAWAAETGLRETPVPDHARVAGEAELLAAASLPGVTLASHSWSHPNLARLDSAALHEQLTRPLAWLRQRFAAAVIPWLSYPYGISSPEVEAAAARAGYRAALRVDGDWLSAGSAPAFAVPRLNIPAGMTIDGFVLRTSGVIRR